MDLGEGTFPVNIVHLANGKPMHIEIKGINSPQNKAKCGALNQWVIAINAASGFGQ